MALTETGYEYVHTLYSIGSESSQMFGRTAYLQCKQQFQDKLRNYSFFKEESAPCS